MAKGSQLSLSSIKIHFLTAKELGQLLTSTQTSSPTTFGGSVTRAKKNTASYKNKDKLENFRDIKAPSPLLMMMEWRAPWEYAAMLASSSLWDSFPKGDGHPVIVFPGLGANDFLTLPLRNFLAKLGYTPYPWDFGFNFGPKEGVLKGCAALVHDLVDRYGSQVSLIGWSLGGIYAREIAKEAPTLIRSVITLGTPFSGHARATNAWRIYELLSGQKVEDHTLQLQLAKTPPVPTTSIYSKTDGVVAWQCSINPPGQLAENIQVSSSHVGMVMNPLVQYAIADRLAQAKDQWQPFEISGHRKWFFKNRDSD